MNLNELMKNAIEMAKKVGAEKRLNKIELRKLMETGATERAHISAGKGPGFGERRAVYTDAQKYIDDLRDKDTKKIRTEKYERPLTDKEIKVMYDSKVTELEGKYIGKKTIAPGASPKEEMVITGDVLVDGKKVPQRDLARLFPGATYQKPLISKEVAPQPAPGIDLRDIAPQYAGTMMGTSPSQLNLPDVTKPAPATAQLTLPKEESGIMGRSLQGTMGGEAVKKSPRSLRETIGRETVRPIAHKMFPTQARAAEALGNVNLTDLYKLGSSAAGPLWEFLKRDISKAFAPPPNLADLFR